MTEATAIAMAFLAACISGDFAGATKRFGPAVKAAVPPEELERTWQATQEQAGAFEGQGEVTVRPGVSGTAVVIECLFAEATWEFQIVVADERIVGLQLAPKGVEADHPIPKYIDGGVFVEEPITVGAPGWPLPATLALPRPKRLRNRAKPPFPAVVFVHGSGPHDRDEMIGGSAPFFDLGLALACRGIATLRYEKRTKEHRGRVTGEIGDAMTLEHEVIDDAVAAVAALRKRDDIDPDRIVVCGHSLGGSCAPAIGERDLRIAGLIIMAGATRPLEELIVEQHRYLAGLVPEGPARAKAEKEIEALERAANRVKGLADGATFEPSKLPLNIPPAYWASLREHDPRAVAPRAKQPMLILQGERDYQVTMEDFEGWRAILGGRSDVTFKSFKGLNHLFTLGKGPSTPAEYATPRYVDKVVVDAIVRWMKAR